MKEKNEGFSLIEVVIAITVLAVLAMPILAYFTNASVSTSGGKTTQKANMAAQSVTEELNSCTSFEQIEDKLVAATGSAWTVESKEEKQSKLSKNVTVDGTAYQTKVTLDYDYSTTDSNGDETASKYNDYAAPKLSEVYSPSNIVAAETDQTKTATANFLYTHSSLSETQLVAAMSRTLTVDVTKVSSGGELYLVKVYYVYEYDGETYQAVIEDTKIEAEKMKNIYIFYNLLRDNLENEMVEVNFSNVSMEEAEKINLYFVCQKTSVTKPTNYALNISGAATGNNYLKANYYTNGITVTHVTAKENLIDREKTKRIARMTVDVYSFGETVFTDSTRLVRLQTSKGE